MALDFQISVDGDDLPAVLSMDRQIEFAAAAAATETAKESVGAVIEEIKKEFDTTNPWYLLTNRFGIHFTPATRQHPTASVHTNAYWLKPHETGEDKTPTDGEFLAVPTEAIKEPHQPIPAAKRPANLADSVLLETKRGPKIFQRINRRLQLAYNLVRRVKIKKRSTVIEPTIATTNEKFADSFSEELKEAFRTAK